MRHVIVLLTAALLALAIEPLATNQVAMAKPSKHEEAPPFEGLPDEFPEQVMRIDAATTRPVLLALLPGDDGPCGGEYDLSLLLRYGQSPATDRMSCATRNSQRDA